MPLKTDVVEEPNLNLTPMIDIVFLLIIFFMVGTQFTEMERQYDIQLPTVTDAPPLTSLPDQIFVNVSKTGDIFMAGEPIDLAELENRLVEASTNYYDQAVVIREDGEGQYQYLMDVMAACRRAGIQHISLANRLKTEGE